MMRAATLSFGEQRRLQREQVVGLGCRTDGGQAPHGRLAIVANLTVTVACGTSCMAYQILGDIRGDMALLPTILKPDWSAALVDDGSLKKKHLVDIEHGSIRHSVQHVECCVCVFNFANASACIAYECYPAATILAMLAEGAMMRLTAGSLDGQHVHRLSTCHQDSPP